MSARFLHVANGGCTTDVIAAAGIPGMRSIWADPLYEGPVPGDADDDQLIEIRSRFLGPDDGSPVDPWNDLKRWRSIIADHQAYEELVLWFEHDLFDQLALVQLLSWIPSRLPASKAVSLVCIGSFPGRPRFKGLGELTPPELAPLIESRSQVSDAQYALAERAWRAFRAATPEPLDELRRSDTAALPYLARAIDRFLQEYPWTADGLSRSERRLLRLAQDGPIDLVAAFQRMHDEEDAYYIMDGSLESLVDTLSRTSPPLVHTAGQERGGWLAGTVGLTEAGREVLDGRRDRVACGLDRWLGGVHLQSADSSVWRWDNAARRMIPS